MDPCILYSSCAIMHISALYSNKLIIQFSYGVSMFWRHTVTIVTNNIMIPRAIRRMQFMTVLFHHGSILEDICFLDVAKQSTGILHSTFKGKGSLRRQL